MKRIPIYPKPKLSDTLRSIALHTRDAMTQLNTAETTCKCCGLKRRTHWDEAQLAMELDAMVTKLTKWAKKLDANAMSTASPGNRTEDENKWNR